MGHDDDATELLPYLMNRAAGSFNRRWLEHLRTQDLTVARWQVLAVLSQYDGSRVGQVAAMSSAEQAVTSRVIEQMERDGLVRRRPAPADRRAVEVWLTREGRATYQRLLPAASDLVARATEGIPPAIRRQMTDGLTRMIANLDELPVSKPSTR